jgi:zinc protease
MEVYLQEQRFSPVFCAHVCVKAGSIDETVTEKGIAHALEHMLFKGTESFPEPGSIAEKVEHAGGDINAYTTFDRTVYELSAPAAFARDGLDVLLEMVAKARLDGEDWSRECEVIVEEIKRGLDNPGTLLSRATLASIFAGTECGRPVIGCEDSVRSFSAHGLRAFYERWYVPNNMILVACGDFDAEDLMGHLVAITKELQPGNLPSRWRPPASSWAHLDKKPAVSASAGPYQETRIQLSVRAPSLDDEALVRWDAMMSLLGQGDSSRLVRSVKDGQQLVTSISAGIYAPRYPTGMATISYFATGDTALQALAASLDEIEILAKQEPSEAELKRIVTTMKAERTYARETVEGVVRQTLANLLTAQRLEFEEHYIHELSKVTPRSIQATAREVLQALHASDFSIAAVVSQELREVVNDIALLQAIKTWLSRRAQPLAASAILPGAVRQTPLLKSPRNSDVRQIVLTSGSGVKININYRRTDKIPAVAMGLYALGGQQLESMGSPPGCGSLLSQMLTRGTQSRDYRTFVTELEDRAASIQAFQGRDCFGLRADALIEDFEHILNLTFEAAFRPALAPSEYERVQRESIEALRAQKDSPGSHLGRLSGPLFYGNHAYARPLSGTEESLRAIALTGDEGSISALWQKCVARRDWVLTLAGDFDEDALPLMVAELMDLYLSGGTNHSNGPGLDLNATAPILDKPQVAFDLFEREQAHILLGFRALDVRHEGRTALELAATILSGQGGRLFADLREKQSLAYSVSASQNLSLQGGHFVTYIGTAANKAEVAFQGLKKHLEDLARTPPSERELQRAQQSLLGGQALDSQSLSYQVAQLAFSDLYGMGFDNFLGFRERVSQVTAEQVQRTVAQCLLKAPPVAVVVGPEGTWQPLTENLFWDLGS